MKYVVMYVDNFWLFYIFSAALGLVDIFIFDILKYEGRINGDIITERFVYYVFIPVVNFFVMVWGFVFFFFMLFYGFFLHFSLKK